jgi:hypothetical protein
MQMVIIKLIVYFIGLFICKDSKMNLTRIDLVVEMVFVNMFLFVYRRIMPGSLNSMRQE